MNENIEIIKEQNRHEEEIQKNTIKAVVAGAVIAYGAKKLGEKIGGADEVGELAIELLDAW